MDPVLLFKLFMLVGFVLLGASFIAFIRLFIPYIKNMRQVMRDREEQLGLRPKR